MDVTAVAQEAALSTVETAQAEAAATTPRPSNADDDATHNRRIHSAHDAANSSSHHVSGRKSSPMSSDSWEDGQLIENGDAEASFVIDTVGDVDVDKQVALREEALAQDSNTHMENGLLLPDHVAVIKAVEQQGSLTRSAEEEEVARTTHADDDDLGDYEQLDQDPSTANRYYGAEEKAERRAKEQCTACGELGHDRRHCPHQHCLACGAMDEHPTRACPMSTSCFRCGGMGHQTRSCPQPRRAGGGRNQECERCGSWNHVKALCPTLWRLYAYNVAEDYDRHRAKIFFRNQRRAQSGMRDQSSLQNMEPDPEEVSDLEDEFCQHGEPSIPPMNQNKPWDPVVRWCYNCSASDNHWGDDCPEARTNPTRTNGEPTAFSEFVSRWGPFAVGLPETPTRAGYSAPSSQFSFTVGSDAVMHIAGTSSPRRPPAPKPSLQSRIRDDTTRSKPRAAPTRRHDTDDDEDDNSVADGEVFRWFGRVKAVFRDGGYLTAREARKGMVPLPEHLFREWLQERERDSSIRFYFVKRARIEAAREQNAAPISNGEDTKPTKADKPTKGGEPKLTKAEQRIKREIKKLNAKDKKKASSTKARKSKMKSSTNSSGSGTNTPTTEVKESTSQKTKANSSKQRSSLPTPQQSTTTPSSSTNAESTNTTASTSSSARTTTPKKGPESKKPRHPKKNRHYSSPPATTGRTSKTASPTAKGKHSNRNNQSTPKQSSSKSAPHTSHSTKSSKNNKTTNASKYRGGYFS